MTPEEFGYSAWFARQVDPETESGLVPARVSAIHKGECEVCDGETTCTAKMSGRLRHQARSRLDYPTVGDWVLVKDFGTDDFGTVQRLLDRRSALVRKTAGRAVRPQLIAANIDLAFIMQTVGPGYNLQRLERYLVMVNESGIKPVLLLSKTDLLDPAALEERLEEIGRRLPGVERYAFSNEDGTGLDGVMALFRPGNTYCIIGSSGGGKTTLLNHLLGEEEYLFTLPVRESDGKGLHSTTWRELIVLDNGALVVDTPGMRELGQLDAAEGLVETFDDIAALAEGCRFADCTHENTPDCAVLAALGRGEVPEARYRNFIRLLREAGHHGRAARERRWKARESGRFHRSRKHGSNDADGEG